jgi:hypothetical protein
MIASNRGHDHAAREEISGRVHHSSCNNGHEARPALFDDAKVRPSESLELSVTADERALQSADAPRPRRRLCADEASAKTSPVFTPIRSESPPPNSSSRRLCIDSAARKARSAWSSCAAGAPKAAMTASPANFSPSIGSTTQWRPRSPILPQLRRPHLRAGSAGGSAFARRPETRRAPSSLRGPRRGQLRASALRSSGSGGREPATRTERHSAIIRRPCALPRSVARPAS